MSAQEIENAFTKQLLSLPKSIEHMNHMKKLYLKDLCVLTECLPITDLLIIIIDYIDLCEIKRTPTSEVENYVHHMIINFIWKGPGRLFTIQYELILKNVLEYEVSVPHHNKFKKMIELKKNYKLNYSLIYDQKLVSLYEINKKEERHAIKKLEGEYSTILLKINKLISNYSDNHFGLDIFGNQCVYLYNTSEIHNTHLHNTKHMNKKIKQCEKKDKIEIPFGDETKCEHLFIDHIYPYMEPLIKEKDCCCYLVFCGPVWEKYQGNNVLVGDFLLEQETFHVFVIDIEYMKQIMEFTKIIGSMHENMRDNFIYKDAE